MKRNSMISSMIICVSIILSTVNSFGQSENANDHIITSSFNNKSYRLFISLPKSYSKLDTIQYPVLYVLDGKYSYASFNSIREVLDLGKEIKNLIIVAIDDNSSTDADWLTNRYNDFTPSHVPKSDIQWSKMMNIADGKLKSGGANAFLNTLQQEMIPFIDKHYKTTPDRGLYGHSLGGLFTGYCLLTEPTLFNRYSINSPAFWWNNNEMLTIENKFVQNNAAIAAKVFFSVGALEGEMMIGPVTAFTNSLKSHNYKGLVLTNQTFESETHLSVVPACNSRTLKVLYGANVK